MDEKSVTSTEPKKNITTTTPYILKGEFFEILKQDGEAVTVQCRKCPEKNIYKGSVKSTGNFHMHIKRKHPESLDRLQELKLKSFMDRKVKIPERLREHTLFTILQNKKNNETYKTTSESPTSSQVSTRHSVIQNLQKSAYNQQTNCKKNKKIKVENQSNLKNHNINIPYGFQNKNNEHFQSQQKSFTTISNNSMKTNKLTPLRNENCNFDQSTKCFNNFYPYQPNSNNFNSITTSANQNNYNFQQNSTAPTQQIPNNNNNNNIAATLTAASMILSPTQDLLGRIDNHLKSIERQLHLRNQIETNKIYLDLAKFKYLHPNFAFQS